MTDLNHIDIKLTIPAWVELTEVLKKRIESKLDDLSVTDGDADDFFDVQDQLKQAVALFTDVCAGHREVHGTGLFKEQVRITNGTWHTQATFECTTIEARRRGKKAFNMEMKQDDPKVEAVRVIDDCGFDVYIREKF